MPLGRVAITKQVAHIADIKATNSYIEGNPFVVAAVNLAGYRAVLSVPMIKDDELVGAIVIHRAEVRPFADKQIDLVQNFAAQAVIAIENTRLLNELRESLQQQTATADVLKVISRSTFNFKRCLTRLSSWAARLCEAENAILFRRQGETYHFAANYAFSQEYAEYMRRQVVSPGRNTLIGRTALEAKTIHIPDVLEDAEYTWVESVRLGGYRTMLGVPLMREGVPVGVFSLTRQQVRLFTDKQIELVTTFADQAVIAIENVRLFDEVQARTRELSEALDQQTATSEVLQVISSSPGELEPVLNAMLENATRLCEAKVGNLFLREGDDFRAVVVHGESGYAHWFRREPAVVMRDQPGTPLDRVPSPNKSSTSPIFGMTKAISTVVPASFRLSISPARDTLVVPMLKEDELIGAIVIYRQEVRPFSDKQIELLTGFARQAVIAIENTRLLNELRQRTGDLAESLDQQTATSEICA